MDGARPSRPDSSLRCVGVTKSFSGSLALQDVTLDVAAGSIHALVGQNGAGKSTLLGIIAGRLAPTTGQVMVNGVPLLLGDPRAARAAGVIAIYQELTIVPAMSACANVYLGQPISRAGFTDDRAMRRGFAALCDRLQARIAPGAIAGTLSIADQQMIEIMRALQADARVILLDEPTAALPPPERGALFDRMRALKAENRTMVLVSHNLDEVLAIADTVSVFRDGHLVTTREAAAWTKATLVEAMLGHAVRASRTHTRRHADGDTLLRVEGLSVSNRIENIDLELHAGEILGVGGLVGSGRTSMVRALAGLEPRAMGQMWVKGRSVAWPVTPREALGHGFALVPEDRKGQGLFLDRDGRENVVVSDFRAVSRAGFLSQSRLVRRAAELSRANGFEPARLGIPVRSLSGGNQQKLILARWQHRMPLVLLADEPTRGIDIIAKEEILQRLRALTAAGLGIILVSSDLDEVTKTSDRIVVLSGGRCAGWLPVASSVSSILDLAFRVDRSGL